MPIQLRTNLYRSTIVVDAAGYLNRDGKPVIEETFREMFRQKEYWYLSKQDFDYAQAGAADAFYTGLEDRLENHQLSDTHLRYNIFIYDEVGKMSAERLNGLVAFIHALHIKLAAVNTDLHTFFVASKYKQDSTAAMENMDRLVDVFLAGNDLKLPQLILLDALPLTKVDASIRATVRVAAIMSRQNTLDNALEGRINNQTFWNWTMTEFDEDELEKINARLEVIEQMLNSHEDFPAGTMESNISKIWHEEWDKLFSGEETIMGNGVPIPADCIKHGLFGAKAAQEACSVYSNLLKKNFELNARERCFSHYKKAEVADLCERLLENIPLNKWNEVLGKLQLNHLGASGHFTIKTPDINPTSSVSAMIKQVNDVISNFNRSLQAYFPEFIAWLLLENIGNWVNGSEANAEWDRYDTERQELENQIADHAGIGDGANYLNRCIDLTRDKIAIHYSSIYDEQPIVLISERIASKWDQYESSCSPDMDKNSIYNFQDLQEYEFQTLHLVIFQKKDYEFSRNSIFRQAAAAGLAAGGKE